MKNTTKSLVKIITVLLMSGLSLDLYGQPGEKIVRIAGDAYALKLQTFRGHDDVDVMYLDENGNVGIGTENPEYKLHVTGWMLSEGAIYSRLSGIETYLTVLRDNSAGFVGTHTDHPLAIGANNDSKMYVLQNGNVGIGIKTPESKLHVKGDFLTEGILGVKSGQVTMHMNNAGRNGNIGWIGTHSKHNLWLGTNGVGRIYLDTLGGVRFTGSANKPTKVIIRDHDQSLAITEGLASQFNLFTTNGIWSEDFAISSKDALVNHPDYVFEESYALSSLDALENYVKTNKHLPDVPGIEQIGKDGYLSLPEQSTGILKNLEEQVLHNIRQEKKITAQEKEIKTQAAQIRAQQEMINALVSRIEKMEERLNR